MVDGDEDVNGGSGDGGAGADGSASTATTVQGTAGTAVAVSDFERFDSAVLPVDHFYANKAAPPANAAAFQRKVTKEWASLRKNLPESIWCRCYEDRTDCLRVAMVGAEGTPYHDGLYFFDLRVCAAPTPPPTLPALSQAARVRTAREPQQGAV
jgi:ubiquitin-conjugating enzyme E2 O